MCDPHAVRHAKAPGYVPMPHTHDICPCHVPFSTPYYMPLRCTIRCTHATCPCYVQMVQFTACNTNVVWSCYISMSMCCAHEKICANYLSSCYVRCPCHVPLLYVHAVWPCFMPILYTMVYVNGICIYTCYIPTPYTRALYPYSLSML